MKTLLLFVLLITGFTSLAQEVRNTVWDATRQQVVDSEKQKPTLITAASIRYDSLLIAQYPTNVMYNFSEDKLNWVQYTAKAAPSDSLRLKNLFVELVKKATIDMGAPKVEGQGDILTKLTFESAKQGAILFLAKLKGGCSLSADYYKRQNK